jgi:polyisoprenoid-binding protein YceI
MPKDASAWRVIPELSKLWAEATSSIHPIRVETDGLTGQIQVDVEGTEVRLQAPFRIEIAAERLRSGNGLVDGELRRRLDTGKFPVVYGSVSEVQALSPDKWLLRGELSLHGITRATTVEVAVRLVDDNTIELAGEKTIDMRDHGLTPPKFLMFRVQPEVRIRARVRAERTTSAQGAQRSAFSDRESKK